MALKFAFKKNPTALKDRLICLWRHGHYYHSEVILAENPDGTYTIASSVPGVGVRTAYNQTLSADEWDILDGPGDPVRAAAWFTAHDGEAYDWFGLLGFFMSPIKDVAKKKWWCTNADMEAAGMTQESWRYDPNLLAATLRNLALVPA
jgi:hypothetical protein